MPSLDAPQHGIVFSVGVLACMALGYVLGELIYRHAMRYALSRHINNADVEAGVSVSETEIRERTERAREARKARLMEGTRKVSLLPLVSYKSEEYVSLSRECAICLEDFEGSDVCRVITGCNHAFHAQCADAWLKKKQQCPVCRQQI